MIPEIDRGALYEKYKHLFVIPFWGFEVPDAWLWVVEKYLEKTQHDVGINGLEVCILQIKEKFGGLRIYADYGGVNADLGIQNESYCEALADYTCEACGCMTRDKVYTPGWVMGLCPTCYQAREDKLNETVS